MTEKSHDAPDLSSIAADETEIVGTIKYLRDNLYTFDPNGQRIRYLIKHRLQYLTSEPDGPDNLYVDPDDGRIWEIREPRKFDGEKRVLACITLEQAKRKYDWSPR